MPEVVRLPGGDDARGRLKYPLGLGPPRIPLHPANRRRAEVETSAGENLSELHFPEGGTEDLETPHEVGDEIGELVHWFGQADQGIGAFLLETPHPGGYGERAHQKDACGLGKVPAPRGRKFENRLALRRGIMGASVRLELLHAGILYADLLAKELDFLLQAIPFSPLSELRVHALRSPVLGQRQGGPGKGDDLDDSRADTTEPASWQGRGQSSFRCWRVYSIPLTRHGLPV